MRWGGDKVAAGREADGWRIRKWANGLRGRQGDRRWWREDEGLVKSGKGRCFSQAARKKINMVSSENERGCLPPLCSPLSVPPL